MNPQVNVNFYNRNFLNGLTPETPIFKYIKIEHLLKMFESQEFWVSKVNSWEDVYENYFLKSIFVTRDGIRGSGLSESERIYGQCWTLKEESDAMWRIYSHDKNSVKVRTTAEKLMDLIYISDQDMATSFIGKVNYRAQADIENDFQEMYRKGEAISDYSNGMNYFMIDSLITKRKEFEHEEEVRIIKMITDDKPLPNPEDHIKIALDPNFFFDEIVLDPRITDNEEIQLKKAIESKGADSRKIRKSSLYSFTPQTIII